MNGQKKSIAQNYYSQYFPSILNESPTDPEYFFPSPFVSNDTGTNLVIENDGFFKCKTTKNSGYISDFYRKVEGIPEIQSYEYYSLIKDKKFDPDKSIFDNYNNDIKLQSSKPALDYLTNERGLTLSTIDKYKIGFDSKNNKIILPILNTTGEGVTSFKSIDFPIKNSKTEGFSRLLNYNHLRLNYKKIDHYIFTIDEIDAVLLSQMGYNVLCQVYNAATWYPDWNYLLDGKKVYIISDKVEDVIYFIDEFNFKRAEFYKLSLNESLSDFFVKNNKTKGDLDGLISTAQLVDKEYVRNYKYFETASGKKQKTTVINTPQDFCDNKMFFGTMLSKELRIITSDKKNLNLNDLIKEGYNLKYPNITYSNFSFEGVKKYLLNSSNFKISDLFRKIKEHLAVHIILPEDDLYSLISLWIMGTYVFRIFNKFPYIHIQAEKASGKSTLLELLKPLTFNGNIYIEPTSAVLFKDVDQNSTTMLIDEVENLKKNSKPTYSSIASILNSGYSKTGIVPRDSKKGIEKFETYSPKVFAGINDISDTTSSRSIKIHMQKKLPDEKIKKYKENDKMNQFLSQLRDDLYIFALLNASKINDKYSDENYTNQYLEKMDGRIADNYTPLFILAELIESDDNTLGTTLTDSIINYHKVDDSIQKSYSRASSETEQLLESVNSILNKLKANKSNIVNGTHFISYTANKFLEEYLALPENKGTRKTQTKLTQELKKIGIDNKVSTGNIRAYEINLEKLEDTGKRYGVEIEKDKIVKNNFDE